MKADTKLAETCKKRDMTFDFLKGIAIISMVLGHCFIPLRLHDFIYIWHMPLFFIISGYFFRVKGTVEELKAIWKGLLVPYLVTAALVVGIFYINDILTGSSDGTNKLINVLTIDVFLLKKDPSGLVGGAGPIWFLLALAWCRYAYHILKMLELNLLWVTVIVIFLSYVAYRISTLINAPFFVLQGIVALQFYHFGYIFRRYKAVLKNNTQMLSFSFFLFVLAMFWGRMEIWGLYFNCYILNITAAVGTSYLIYYFVQKYIAQGDRRGKLSAILSEIGRYSILILAIHTIEKSINLSDIFMNITTLGNENIWYLRLIKISFSLLLCIGGMMIFRKSALIKKIYNIK